MAAAILTLVETFTPSDPKKEPRYPRDWERAGDLAMPRQQTPDRLNDGDPWLVGLDVSVAEREDVADGPRPHQFAEPGRVVLDDYYFKKY